MNNERCWTERDNKSPKWRRRIGNGLVCAAAAMSIFGTSSIDSAGIAQAAPASVEIGVGDVLNLKPIGASYNQLIDFGCNVAAVSEDETELLTAGHCGDVGKAIYNKNTYIGKVTKSEVSGNMTMGVVDYAVVKLAPHVTIDNDAPVTLTGVVEEPRVGMPVYKYGHGIGNAGIREGIVTKVSGNAVMTNIITMACDSGGPIVEKGTGKLVSLTSGMTDTLINVGGITGLVEQGNSVGTRANVILERSGFEIATSDK